MAELPAFRNDVWELYGPDDWTQAHDLAADQPDKLQELFLTEARRYGVLPLDDRRVERFDAEVAGRPTLIQGRSEVLFSGMGRLTEATVEYDGGGPARGGTVQLLVDGQQAGAGRLEQTVPLIFSIDETCDVGRDTGSSVTDEYTAASSEFSGTIEQARIELAKGAPDFRDLIDPEHRLAVALARQ